MHSMQTSKTPMPRLSLFNMRGKDILLGHGMYQLALKRHRGTCERVGAGARGCRCGRVKICLCGQHRGVQVMRSDTPLSPVSRCAGGVQLPNEGKGFKKPRPAPEKRPRPPQKSTLPPPPPAGDGRGVSRDIFLPKPAEGSHA